MKWDITKVFTDENKIKIGCYEQLCSNQFDN